MSIHHHGDRVTIHHGSCLDILAQIPDNSVDAVVTDPPYGLANTTPEKITETVIRWANGERDYLPDGKGFMGNPWDAFVPPAAVWDDCLRVLKPGGHVLAFAGSRTVDLMTLGLRLAGFDIRDSIAWLYGSGFPKSLDVSKAIDKLDASSIREQRNYAFTAWMRSTGITARQIEDATGTKMGGHYLTDKSQPAVAVAPLFDLLRPLLPEVPRHIESLVAERTVESENYKSRPITQTEVRPLVSGDHIGFDQRSSKERERRDIPATDDAHAWSGWGTALKPGHEPIVVARKPLTGTVAANVLEHGTGALNIDACRIGMSDEDADFIRRTARPNSAGMPHTGDVMNRPAAPTVNVHPAGRWPANVILDETQAAALDQMSGIGKSGTGGPQSASRAATQGATHGGQSGGYNYGANGNKTGHGDSGGASRFFYVAKAGKSERPNVDGVAHPTVKPLALMRWLVRLVTPPGGTILEPFAGSGTTIEAALLEGFNVIGIERESDYLPLIDARIARALATDSDLFGGAA